MPNCDCISTSFCRLPSKSVPWSCSWSVGTVERPAIGKGVSRPNAARSRIDQLLAPLPSPPRKASQPMANQSMDHSPFASLPAELRNGIYEFAIPCSDTVAITPAHPFATGWLRQPPTLLQVCRQIRAEASGLFYARNTLYSSLKSYWVRDKSF